MLIKPSRAAISNYPAVGALQCGGLYFLYFTEHP
jgi:hypothetical protein